MFATMKMNKKSKWKIVFKVIPKHNAMGNFQLGLFFFI